MDKSNNLLLIGESDEKKWSNTKPAVFWVKLKSKDINKYSVGSKITVVYQGPLPAKLPSDVVPKSIQVLEDILSSKEKDFLNLEINKLNSTNFFIKQITFNKDMNTWSVELYNYEGQKLKDIAISGVK